MAHTSRLDRISVGLSEREYGALQTLSEEHRVSMAWLGRQAIIEFLERHPETETRLPLNLPPKQADKPLTGKGKGPK